MYLVVFFSFFFRALNRVSEASTHDSDSSLLARRRQSYVPTTCPSCLMTEGPCQPVGHVMLFNDNRGLMKFALCKCL
ncbi:hypothetical protein K443DRAFT_205534 [Laccaria amethystina LaAM-08-1]|jgi:hypothetical protein|uniref:Unplaced genomic scaffold K443scaffold_130, whole genome shotgun sequence n=1 Tax=Laccaria amethystina LaAM-08-1 TaxID=1095629 RepID=A0A0C9XRN9_9AGAR|nr:hypothetical protein K443DRAFT_205534 [Laccaria amethystina LaAM-08-1]